MVHHSTVGECVERTRPHGKLLEAELVLAKVLGESRERVFAHPETVLRGKEMERFEELWGRIEAGEPLAYVLGRKEFYGLEFSVDSRVLVPRPETEHLVEKVLELAKGVDEPRLTAGRPRILDVGTGCGAIAVALAHALPKAQVWACDVSGEALQVARANAERLLRPKPGERPRLGGAVQFFQSDLLSNIPWATLNLDVLVANLPYIGTEEFHFVAAAVDRYEPSVALYGGADGLDLYRQLFEQINCSSKVSVFSSRDAWPRWVLGEFGCFQRERLEHLIREAFPGSPVSFYPDLAGLDRFFVLTLRP